MSEPQPYGAKINTQEIINYCHSRGLSAHKVALVSSDGTHIVVFPVESLNASTFRTSAFSNDAGLLRVSSLGGVFTLSADASGNRVSCIQEDATNTRISAFSNDAGLFRVSSYINGGSISSMQSLPNVVWSGRLNLASSAANSQLGSASLYQGVIIKSISANLSACYVGNSAVGPTNYHYELEPGEATAVGVNNLSCIYVAVIANNDGVQYIGS